MNPIRFTVLFGIVVSILILSASSSAINDRISSHVQNENLDHTAQAQVSTFSNQTNTILNSHITSEKLIVIGTVNVSSLPKVVPGTHDIPHPMPFLKVDSAVNSTQENSLQSYTPNSFASTTEASTAISTSAVSISSGYDGLSQGCPNCVPPDVQVAAGPNHVVEMVNLQGKIWNKTNTQLSSFSTFYLSDFFKTGGDFISDPKIFYDSSSGRWFAVIIDITTNRANIAVSQTNDPTNNFTIFADPFTGCPDRPETGVSDDKFVVSVNVFSNGCVNPFVGAEYDVFDKAQLLAGNNMTMHKFGPDNTRSSIRPAQSLSSTLPLYMVSVHGGSTNQLELYNVTGTFPNFNSNMVTLPIRQINNVPNATQPGTTVTLNTNDGRVLDAVWNKNKLWLSLNDGCTPNGDILRSCARLIEIDTSTTNPTSPTQDFDINKTGTYYFYPALRTDSSGGIVTVFGVSNSTVYPSLLVTGQSASDPPNSYKPVSYLKIGSQPDNDTDSKDRYGDYFGAALDPSNSERIWTAGEYYTVDPHTWSTFVGSVDNGFLFKEGTFTKQPLGPTQFARPSSDISTGGWTPTPLYSQLNEVIPNDTTNVVSPTGTSPQFQVKLSNVSPPITNTGLIIKFRAEAPGGSGSAEKANAVLFQGSTQIAQTGLQTLSRTSFTTFTYTLTSAEAASITDYTNLSIQIQTSKANTEVIKVSWIEFDVPPALTVQSITGLTFKPKALILFTTSQTSQGSTDVYNTAMGFSNGTNSKTIGVQSDDNVTPSNAGRAFGSKIIKILSSGTPTIAAEADLASFDANGFTLKWTTNDASAPIIHYIAIGGNKLTNAAVSSLTASTTAGSQAVTGLAFQPDFVMFMHAASTSDTSTSTNGYLSFGFAKPSNRAALAFDSVTGSKQGGNTHEIQRTDLALVGLNPATAAINMQADLVSMNPTGFTLNWIQAPTTADKVYYLALKGGVYDVGSFDKTTQSAPVTQTINTPAIVPRGLILTSFNNVANTAVQSNNRISFGATDGIAQSTIWAGDQNAAKPTITARSTTTSDVIRMATEQATGSSSTINAEANIASINLSGFKLNWTTNDAVAKQLIYVQMGDIPSTIKIVEKTVPQDNTVFQFTSNTLSPSPFTLYDNNTVHNSTTFINLQPGTYDVSETTNSNYITTSSCSNGNPVNAISVNAGDTVTCTFTNSVASHITVIKQIDNTGGGTLTISGVTLRINGTVVTNDTSNLRNPGTYVVSEDTIQHYQSTIGGDCASDGTVTLAGGNSKICIITNTYLPPPIITSPVSGSTFSANPIISGTAKIGATITVFDNSTSIATISEDGSGNWTLAPSFSSGFHTITATQSINGVTSLDSVSVTFTFNPSQTISAGDTFDTGLDGWSYYGEGGYNVFQDTSNGNPAPSATVSGDVFPIGHCYEEGMEKTFDISSYTSGPMILRYDLRTFANFPSVGLENSFITVRNNDTNTILYTATVIAVGEIPGGDSGWRTYAVDISPHITGATKLKIQPHFFDCWGADYGQFNSYDNISLLMGTTPVPSLASNTNSPQSPPVGAPYFYPEVNQTSANVTRSDSLTIPLLVEWEQGWAPQPVSITVGNLTKTDMSYSVTSIRNTTSDQLFNVTFNVPSSTPPNQYLVPVYINEIGTNHTKVQIFAIDVK